MITINKDVNSNIESCWVTSDARHPRVCARKKKTRDWKWPVCLLLSLLAWFWPFWPGYGLSDLCLAFLTLYITWLFAKKMSFVFSRQTVDIIYKRICRNCPISSCGAKYLVRLANHLADVHQLHCIQRRQYSQEPKLQPKVKVVVYESEEDKKITQLVLAIQYRHKKRCTNCQDHEEMKPLLKQKLKDWLKSTRQSARNKESRTLGFEAIGELCRHGRIIYDYSLK